jgi:hypothetical protein
LLGFLRAIGRRRDVAGGGCEEQRKCDRAHRGVIGRLRRRGDDNWREMSGLVWGNATVGCVSSGERAAVLSRRYRSMSLIRRLLSPTSASPAAPEASDAPIATPPSSATNDDFVRSQTSAPQGSSRYIGLAGLLVVGGALLVGAQGLIGAVVGAKNAVKPDDR